MIRRQGAVLLVGLLLLGHAPFMCGSDLQTRLRTDEEDSMKGKGNINVKRLTLLTWHYSVL